MNSRLVTKMIDLNYVLKCSLIEQLNITSQLLANVSASVPAEISKPAGYGALTGIALAVLASGIFNQQFRDRLSAPSFKLKKSDSGLNAKNLQRGIALFVLLLILPVLMVSLLFAFSYKQLCSLIIKRKDKRFVGFLDSFDVFWSLEDDTVKSVINVLGVIQADSPSAVVENIKDKLQTIIPNKATDKIFFRREEKYGFYYWRRNSCVDINKYVEIVDFPDKPRANMEDLETLMTEISRHPLPYNNEGLFKILVTKQRVGDYDEEKGEYGIVFRIHHSVGDGVALIEFLCSTLADNKDDCPLHLFSIPKMSNMNSVSPKSFTEMIEKLWEMPICLVDGILRKPDASALHGPNLLNKQIFKWTQSDEKLLTMVKDIKESVDNMKFTDVLAAALSSGLLKFFSQTSTLIPEDVAVVLPVRFPKTPADDSDIKMENDFSVTILDLPVNNRTIDAVQSRCDALRMSADPLTNYYLLKVLNSVLPKQVLQPLLNSSQATMVFSNLPGPSRLSICGGLLTELIFFVPQRGNTGIGVTALCYDGVLRFGAVADTALVSDPADLALILDGIVAEIGRLHQKHAT